MAANPTTIIPKIGNLPVDAHHIWFYGYIGFFFLSIIYILNTALFRFTSIPTSGIYTLALTAVLTSLGINLGQTVKTFSFTVDTLYKAMECDSLPYLMLTLVMLTTPPAPIAVLPMVIYAAYHIVSFVQNDQKLSRHPKWKQYGEPLSIKLLSIQQSAMVFAAHLEVTTLPWLILSFILQRGASLLQVLTYAQFLSWQFMTSERVKVACIQWDAAITEGVKHPSCPPFVKQAEKYIRSAVKTIGQQFPQVRMAAAPSRKSD
jgi:hypothetical protein